MQGSGLPNPPTCFGIHGHSRNINRSKVGHPGQTPCLPHLGRILRILVLQSGLGEGQETAWPQEFHVWQREMRMGCQCMDMMI